MNSYTQDQVCSVWIDWTHNLTWQCRSARLKFLDCPLKAGCKRESSLIHSKLILVLLDEFIFHIYFWNYKPERLLSEPIVTGDCGNCASVLHCIAMFLSNMAAAISPSKWLFRNERVTKACPSLYTVYVLNSQEHKFGFSSQVKMWSNSNIQT